MQEQGVVAVGRWAARGKEQLVLIRPYGDEGLILHQLFYANEVRSFGEVDTGAKLAFTSAERDLAKKLIEQLTSDKFEPANYKDQYEERVRAVVDQKVAGQEITIAPEAPRAQIIDLFEALKRSLAETEARAGERVLKPPKKAEVEPPALGRKVAARRRSRKSG
jgi:DNA end-binding protein Ku